MPRSKAEEWLAVALAEQALPGWDLTREFPFDKARKWKFDFAFPSQKLAAEINGAGRHQSFKGMTADYEKWNEAVRQGWRVLLFRANAINPTSAQRAAAFILEVLCCPPSTALDSGE